VVWYFVPESWFFNSYFLSQFLFLQYELLRILYPVFIHCFMDLVAEGHMQEGTSDWWIWLDIFTVFFVICLSFLKKWIYILQVGHFFIHFERTMKWCTQGIFRSWKASSPHHIWRLFSFSFIMPSYFERTPVCIMITSSLFSILQEMELARSLRQNKFKIKLCEVTVLLFLIYPCELCLL
jgi:hypothetical protein